MLFWNEKRKFKVVCDYCLKEYDVFGDPRNENNKNYLIMYYRRLNGKITLNQVCCIPPQFLSIKLRISSVHRLKWYMKKYQLLEEGWVLVQHELKPDYPGINYRPSTKYI